MSFLSNCPIVQHKFPSHANFNMNFETSGVQNFCNILPDQEGSMIPDDDFMRWILQSDPNMNVETSKDQNSCNVRPEEKLDMYDDWMTVNEDPKCAISRGVENNNNIDESKIPDYVIKELLKCCDMNEEMPETLFNLNTEPVNAQTSARNVSRNNLMGANSANIKKQRIQNSCNVLHEQEMIMFDWMVSKDVNKGNNSNSSISPDSNDDNNTDDSKIADDVIKELLEWCNINKEMTESLSNLKNTGCSANIVEQHKPYQTTENSISSSYLSYNTYIGNNSSHVGFEKTNSNIDRKILYLPGRTENKEDSTVVQNASNNMTSKNEVKHEISTNNKCFLFSENSSSSGYWTASESLPAPIRSAPQKRKAVTTIIRTIPGVKRHKSAELSKDRHTHQHRTITARTGTPAVSRNRIAKSTIRLISAEAPFTFVSRTPDGMFACGHCEHVDSNVRQLLLHIDLKHQIFTLQCPGCNETREKAMDYSRHLDVFPNHIPTLRNCRYCKYKTQYESVMNIHQTSHKKSVIQAEQVENEKKIAVINRFDFNCDLCSYATPNYKQFVIHKFKIHKIRNLKCPKCDFVGFEPNACMNHFLTNKKHIMPYLTQRKLQNRNLIPVTRKNTPRNDYSNTNYSTKVKIVDGKKRYLLTPIGFIDKRNKNPSSISPQR